MAAFTGVPALARIRPPREPLGHDRKRYCRAVTPSMRFAPAAPSALAVAAASFLVAGALHPTALPPAARRGAPPAAVAALLTAALLRPRVARKRRRDNGAAPRAVVLPSVEVAQTGMKSGRTDMQSVFSSSRREWDTPAPPKSAPETRSEPGTGGPGTVNNDSSTVYSYRYARSKKKKPRCPSSDDGSRREGGSASAASRMDGTFGHMREEFLSQTGGASGSFEDEVEYVNFREDAWEDKEDEYAWQSVSRRVMREQQVSSASDRDVEDETLPPRPLAAATLVRLVVRAPMWVLAEVVLPVVDIVALVWYDFKVWLLGLSERRSREGVDRYFLPKLKAKRGAVDEEESEELLSQEEKQIRQVHTTAKKVVDGVEGTVRKLFDDFL